MMQVIKPVHFTTTTNDPIKLSNPIEAFGLTLAGWIQ